MTKLHEPSRRGFLTAAGAAVLGFACGSKRLAVSEESPVDEALLYVGTYTNAGRSHGVYLLRMDRRSGRLRSVGSIDAGANPSFLAIHPNGRVLYAVNEVEQGAVSTFAIAGTGGGLTRLGHVSSEGSAPCYVSVDKSGQVVLVANYDSGNVALLPIQGDGTLAQATSIIQHTGRGPIAERQHGPHAHCIIADPSNQFAIAADLGADRVLVYRLDLDHGSLRPNETGAAIMRPGSGPRHLAFHPTLPLVFVANELDSTVATLHFDAELGELTVVGTRSTLPAGWTGTNFPADIHITPSGRALYVSNRGHDSIAVFSVAESTGALALVQTVSTGGDWPRNFSLDPTGRWLLVAHQRSNSIVAFGRDEQSGTLTPTGQRIAVPSPVCLRFHASA